jgi:alkylation response protein AidB-like acyl-CoA dehydrogenase
VIRSIIKYGNYKQREILDSLFQGEEIACFALTELGHGSNTKDIETIVTRVEMDKGESYLLVDSGS